MKWHMKNQIDQITTVTWKRFIVASILIIIAAGLRVWPLESLETRLAWLTFYPAVMLAAVYGGVAVGTIATSLSCFIIAFLWPLLTTQSFMKEPADWLGMAFFFMTCIMISFVAEAMRCANLRAKRAQEEAQLANQSKSRFLANMSHELRTPLNAILGYSQMMQRDELLSPQHREYLQTINRSGEHLLSLINDVLTIAKIESKGATLEEDDYNFHRLVKDLQKMFQAQADEKKIALTIIGLENIPQYLYGDEKKLRVILINLIGNAVKFTHDGSILISFSRQEVAEQIVMTTVVEDTGVGILEEDISKLFGYFVQTESGRKNSTGTGLGLAISQEYIRLMGGDISVTSHIDKGSIFSFKIPIVLRKNDTNQERLQLQNIIGIKKGLEIPRILVAEDIEENRSLLVTLLSNIGFEVKEAVNGKEAVDVFQKWHPHFIWMDIRMPVMDGLEATKLIRATENGLQVKIVALSAHVLAGEVAEIIMAGCDGFVAKPYREYEIFDAMGKNLAVEYVYQVVGNSAPTIDCDMDYEQIKMIPERLLVKLHHAVLELDSEKILAAIGNITEIDTTLGIALTRLAQNMNYTQLLLLTKNTEVQ